MAHTPRPFEQLLAHRVADAEVRIAMAHVVFMSIFAAWNVVGSLVAPELTGLGQIALGSRMALLFVVLAALLWNVYLALRIRAARRVGQLPHPVLKWLAVTWEALVPSAALAVTTTFLPPVEVVGAPFLPVYGVPLALAALRLQPILCWYGGLLASGSCLVVCVLATQGDTGFHSAVGNHVLRAISILSVGAAAALVARVLRDGFGSAVAALEERNRVVGVFGRYLSDDVVDTLLHQPGGLELGGRKQPVSVLMTDLRGFSTLASELSAEQVVCLLNHYLGAMTTVIMRHGGTIDEFIGDAILVVFNAPIEQVDHVDRALRCAVEMQLEMATVNAWNAERGLPLLEMGVGVHTGTAVVGNIGSEKRQKYGVVGTTVNLTARVEAHTVGGQVLTTQACIDTARSTVHSAFLRSIHPKGAAEPLAIHSVMGVGRRMLDISLPDSVPVVPQEVEVFRVAGKERQPTSITAALVGLSSHEVWLDGLSEPLPAGTDIVLHVAEGVAFGRVMDATNGVVEVRFTARDAPAMATLTALLDAGPPTAGPVGSPDGAVPP